MDDNTDKPLNLKRLQAIDEKPTKKIPKSSTKRSQEYNQNHGSRVVLFQIYGYLEREKFLQNTSNQPWEDMWGWAYDELNN